VLTLLITLCTVLQDRRTQTASCFGACFMQQQKRQKLLSDACEAYFPFSSTSNNVKPRGPLRMIVNKSAIYCEVNKVSAQLILSIHREFVTSAKKFTIFNEFSEI